MHTLFTTTALILALAGATWWPGGHVPRTAATHPAPETVPVTEVKDFGLFLSGLGF